jgi:hypothetical protein
VFNQTHKRRRESSVLKTCHLYRVSAQKKSAPDYFQCCNLAYSWKRKSSIRRYMQKIYAYMCTADKRYLDSTRSIKRMCRTVLKGEFDSEVQGQPCPRVRVRDSMLYTLLCFYSRVGIIIAHTHSRHPRRPLGDHLRHAAALLLFFFITFPLGRSYVRA